MKILILEDDAERINWLLAKLYPHRVYVSRTAMEAIGVLTRETFDVIFLDHDLSNEHYQIYDACELSNEVVAHIGRFDHETGFAVAKYLRDNPDRSPNAQIIIHTMNSWQGDRMHKELEQRPRVVRAPFSRLRAKGFWLVS
jgi:CheY-like chemotaxis protein